ncbi:hypothetical protein LTS18_013567, partial [Coniosporium uncinatum]
MMAQYRSICRGEGSIFGRLRAAGIDAEDYIQFYALRSWGRVGPNKALVTEQLYIHAKAMVVDDRVAIIGSANINERSMLGSRDSEVACIIRDKQMMSSVMAGEPYMVGKFPHTLRMRLMREHLGIDVDKLAEKEREQANDLHGDLGTDDEDEIDYSDLDMLNDDPDPDKVIREKLIASEKKAQDELLKMEDKLRSFNHDVDWEEGSNPNILNYGKKVTEDQRVQGNKKHKLDVEGFGVDHMQEMKRTETEQDNLAARDTTYDSQGCEVLLKRVASEGRGTVESPRKQKSKKDSGRPTPEDEREAKKPEFMPPPKPVRMNTEALGLTQLSQLPALPDADDTDIGGPPLRRTATFTKASASEILAPLIADLKLPVVTDDCMRDPVSDSFHLGTWHAVARDNTALFRQVFRCQPDNDVRNWDDYKEYNLFTEKWKVSQGLGSHLKQESEPKGT